MLYFTDCPLYGPDSSKLASTAADLDGTFTPNAHYSTNVSFTGGFYNFSVLLSSSSDVLNSR